MISGCGSPPALRRSTAASAMARTWSSMRPGMVSSRRTPRRPSIGLASWLLRTTARSSSSAGSSSPRSRSTATLTLSSVRSGRNSCSGGSMRRTVMGLPFIVSNIWMKSPFCSGRRAARAASRSASEEARMRFWTNCLRSPRNMCSVRHRPTPWAPRWMAWRASSGVSALARTSRRRTASAWPMRRSTAVTSSRVSSSPAALSASSRPRRR